MVAGLGPKSSIARPSISRSRSHTVPSSTNVHAAQCGDLKQTQTSSRPTHERSNSYLLPVETKPRNANTLPLEKTSSRLHLPGSSKHGGEHRHFLHKHSRSHAEQYQHTRGNNDTNTKLPHSVAGHATERGKRATLEQYGTNGSDLLNTRTHDFKQVTSHKGRPILARDGTRDYGAVDPRMTAAPLVRKTSTEVLLDRAEARKVAKKSALTTHDIEIMKQNQDAADVELRDRLADVNTTTAEIMRRLDYTYYSLLEKSGNLVGTVQSFQNLSTQSHQLITNFEHETSKLNGDVQRRIKKFKAGFEEREARIAVLERRGTSANSKAKELGTRLDNARVIVGNWEKRERATKRKWGRFWGGLWWTLGVISILVLMVVLGKELWFHGDPVAAGLSLPRHGARNRSWALNTDQLSRLKVPLEVRAVLEDVEERRRTKKIWPALPHVKGEEARRKKDAERLRVLDEL